MNLPTERAWARMFCEWLVQRPHNEVLCYETEYYHHRKVAQCPHMIYHRNTVDEGTSGTFEQGACPAYLSNLDGVSDDECIESYRWLRDHCFHWDYYLDWFSDWLMEQANGEER